MRYNLARHSLLKELAKKFGSFGSNENDESKIQASLVGLTLSEIDSHLKLSKAERELVLSGLGDAKEIEAFRDGFDKVAGYFITDNVGLNSFVEKKYLHKNNDIILNWLKNIVQLFIPVASLTVAILALSLKFDSRDKILNQKIESSKDNIIKLNERINNLEFQIKNEDSATRKQNSKTK
jgi:hypothetical protein